MFSLINFVLGLALLVLVVIILVRNILIGIKGTDNGVINLVLVALILVGIFCAFSVLMRLIRIDSLGATLTSKEILSMERIELIKKEIAQLKNNNIISLIVGYCTLVFDFIIFKNIEKKKKLDLAKGKKRWNWNKIK